MYRTKSTTTAAAIGIQFSKWMPKSEKSALSHWAILGAPQVLAYLKAIVEPDQCI